MGGPGFRGSLRDLLRHRLGLEFDRELVREDWQVELPRDEEKLCAALEELRPAILRHATQERESLVAYAQQAGMLDGGLHGVVDIGYSATIQKGLQAALSIPLAGFYMGSFNTAKAVEKGGGYAFGCLAEGIPPWTSPAPVLAHSLLMEAFLTAPHGQVTGFREEKGRMVAMFKAPSHTAQEAALLTRMHESALDYCRELLEVYGPDLLLAEIEQEMPQEFFRMVVEGRLGLPGDVAAILRVEDNFCGNGELAVRIGAG